MLLVGMYLLIRERVRMAKKIESKLSGKRSRGAPVGNKNAVKFSCGLYTQEEKDNDLMIKKYLQECQSLIQQITLQEEPSNG
jgi:hypothetical protein